MSGLLIVLLAEERSEAAAARYLERVLATVAPEPCEIVVLVQTDAPEPPLPELRRHAAPAGPVRIEPDVRRYGHGGRRKIAYDLALARGAEHVLVVEPDERFPPEAIPALREAMRARAAGVVIASRGGRGAATRALAALLGLAISGWAAPHRLIACAVLRRIPFHRNGDGRGFDTEVLIQCRALGVEVAEIAADAAPDAGFSAREALGLALGYRCHQLHLTRHGQYLVDHDVHYTLKHHPASSHAQVLDAVRAGAFVLDLGCSQGLLAAPLAAKGARVVGVDVRAPEAVSQALSAYWQHDLERPLEIPYGRVFDYVICADVIEHVVHRAELLRSVRRYLKPDGRLLISTPNIAVWFYRLSLLAGRFEYGPRGVLDETHVHLFTRATFRREIEGAGFRIVAQRVTALPFEVAFESTGRSRVVRAITSAYHAVARLWPAMFAYQFLLEAEVRAVLDEPRPATQAAT